MSVPRAEPTCDSPLRSFLAIIRTCIFFLQNHLKLVSEPFPMNSCQLWLKHVWDVEHRWYEVAMLLNTHSSDNDSSGGRLLCELCRLASCRHDTPYSQYKDHVGEVELQVECELSRHSHSTPSPECPPVP